MMNGLPKTFDGNKLAGHTLQQICFGEYQIIFRFDEGLTIAVESELVYEDDTGSTAIQFPILQSTLMQLLGHTIVEALGDEEGTLTLKFDHGHALKCLDHPHYEAYQISQGDSLIVV